MTEKNRGLVKKLFIIGGALFGLFLVAVIVSIPFFIDVDSYRPKIVGLANEQIHGELSMGKLTLSLWGQVKVQVDGFSLQDSTGRKIIQAKDVFFHIPFLSILTGSPQISFRLSHPEVHVVKDKAGKLNVLSLVKAGAPAESQGAKATAPVATAPSAKREIPGIAARARLSIEMLDAHITYEDQATKLVSEVQDLNALLRDISLSRPMEAEIWADLNTKMGKTMSASGPAKLTARFEPVFSSTGFPKGTLRFKGELDGGGSLPFPAFSVEGQREPSQRRGRGIGYP